MLQKLHHVAYRCNDARETVEFYSDVIGLKFAHALTNDYVPSVKMYSPHIHIFFEMADGSYIAFFEVPKSEPARADPNTPSWVQHLALEVKDMDTLRAGKRRLQDHHVDVIGPIDHGFCHSIYFRDPSGHRMEMTCRVEAAGQLDEFAKEAHQILDGWEKRKAEENWPVRRQLVPAE
jgi:catechol 2,3-dioxygenase-like lactoylglutathione lyase family enzyme